MARNTTQGAVRGLVTGMLAGAAGTTTLNAFTYTDMALRGRPASAAQTESIDKLSSELGVRLPGDPQARANRKEGLGALSGIGLGVAVGAAYGLGRALLGPPASPRTWLVGSLVAAAAAMTAADGALIKLGVTDPRDWRTSDWLSDVIPHLGYGAVTAGTLELAGRRS
jgi:hypothetical protein